MGKSYLIEGYRFMIAVSILVYHILRVWEIETNFRLGVEFFFILSGFLLMAHIEGKCTTFGMEKNKQLLSIYYRIFYCDEYRGGLGNQTEYWRVNV